jgi:hypothetical protein
MSLFSFLITKTQQVLLEDLNRQRCSLYKSIKIYKTDKKNEQENILKQMNFKLGIFNKKQKKKSISLYIFFCLLTERVWDLVGINSNCETSFYNNNNNIKNEKETTTTIEIK